MIDKPTVEQVGSEWFPVAHLFSDKLLSHLKHRIQNILYRISCLYGKGGYTCCLSYKALNYPKQDTLGKELPELCSMSQQSLLHILTDELEVESEEKTGIE